MREIRADLALNHCKWDPQIGDRSTLFPQPVLLGATAWSSLSRWSEALAAFKRISAMRWDSLLSVSNHPDGGSGPGGGSR